jgi:hypothetical protein
MYRESFEGGLTPKLASTSFHAQVAHFRSPPDSRHNRGVAPLGDQSAARRRIAANIAKLPDLLQFDDTRRPGSGQLLETLGESKPACAIFPRCTGSLIGRYIPTSAHHLSAGTVSCCTSVPA